MMNASARKRFLAATAGLSGAFVAALAIIALGMAHAGVRADVISLRGGGQLQGKIVPDPTDKDKVQVWMTSGRKPISL
jgi:hypothetical protein